MTLQIIHLVREGAWPITRIKPIIRRTISKGLDKNWRFDWLHYDIWGDDQEIVVLPLIECHYFFHAVAGGEGLLLTSRR